MNATTAPADITAKQSAFLTRLLDEATELLDQRAALTGADWTEARNAVHWMRQGVDEMTRREASAAIDQAMDNNKQLRTELTTLGADVRPVRERHAFVTEVGMYLVDGRVFKVLPSRQSERHYAKELTDFHWEDGSPVADHEGTLKFVYAKGAMALITPEHRMTPEAEREFGKLIGHCIDCGKLLTHPRSIDYGKGPKCSDNYKR